MNSEVEIIRVEDPSIESGSQKLVKNEPTEFRKIEIPIIPPREHCVDEVTVEMVRVRRPVQIDQILIRNVDSGGYLVSMPGGKVTYAGAHQQICLSSIEDVIQLIAHSIGQTTYEYYEVPKREWEASIEDGYLPNGG